MQRRDRVAGHPAVGASFVSRLVPILVATLVAFLVFFAGPASAAVIAGAAPGAPAATAAQGGRAAALGAQIGTLDARLDGVVARYAATAQRLALLRAGVRANRGDLRSTQYSLSLAEAELRSRLVSMYKERPVDLLDVIMGSASFEEMLGKLTIMRQLSSADAALVASTRGLQRELLDRRRALAASIARLQADLVNVGKDRARLETTLGERRSLLAELRKAAPARAKAATQPRTSPTRTPAPAPPPPIVGQGAWWPLIKAAANANGISARGLYRLMLCESGGVAAARNGPYCGLFQYSLSTWHGAWNPWRAAGVFDGAAQIKASALAIKLGLGPRFWPGTFGYAFSG